MIMNLLTARPKGMDFATYKETRRVQNAQVKSYRQGRLVWRSNSVWYDAKLGRYFSTPSPDRVLMFTGQGTYTRSNANRNF